MTIPFLTHAIFKSIQITEGAQQGLYLKATNNQGNLEFADFSMSVDPNPTLGGNLVSDGFSFDTGINSGSTFGLAPTSKLSFYGLNPVVQPCGDNQQALINNTSVTASNGPILVSLDIQTPITNNSGVTALTSYTTFTNTPSLTGSLTGTLNNQLADVANTYDSTAAGILNKNFKEVQNLFTLQRDINILFSRVLALLVNRENATLTTLNALANNDIVNANLSNALRAALSQLGLIAGASCAPFVPSGASIVMNNNFLMNNNSELGNDVVDNPNALDNDFLMNNNSEIAN